MNDTPGWTSPGSASPDGQDGTGVPRPASPADANGSAPQWSKEQPPAGQWQPPTAPAPGIPAPARAQSGTGWGGGPHPQWGPAPAAKPGVIPLRPLTMGEILDGAVTTMRRYWQVVLTISVTVAVISQVADILSQRYLVPGTPKVDADASPAEQLSQTADAVQSTMTGMVPAILIAMIATLVCAALLTVVISRAVLGRPVTIGAAWQEARPRVLPLIGLTLLLAVMSVAISVVAMLPGLLAGSAPLAAAGLLAGVVVVVWLGIRFSLASPALMLERQGIFKAMARSAKLVQGSWWRIFGITILTQLLIFVFSMIVAIPFTMIAMLLSPEGIGGLLSGTSPENSWSFLITTGIGGVIIGAVTYPISAGVTALLYVDQRIRREALDLELARAAGLPGYGG
ncbi:hypothetical protein [Streptomyces sp. NPDC048659]|uniref:DUF7544 domain-containing protein n=1 Tax=Streptomyces sp. NPDC048659 TaxID=3155489 RepID=UPI003447B38E